MKVEKIVVVFLDGVGLGDDSPQSNPFARTSLPVLGRLLNGQRIVRTNAGLSTDHASLLALDAQLGIPGLPQSGTGQTAILTGVNAPALIGQHDGPYPNQQLRDLLTEDNLFKRLLAADKQVAFANAYSDRFLGRRERGTQRLGANSRAAVLAGLKLRSPEDLKIGKAVSALITNDFFVESGYDVPDVTPAQAGEQLARLASDYALTFFELWYTDVAGHHRDWPLARHILSILDQFLGGVLDTLDMSKSLLVIVSDHGNFEDLSTSKHTHNPALGLVVGDQHAILAAHLHKLTDVTPLLASTLNDH